MDLSRSRSRRVKITYTIAWPQQKNGGHLLAPNSARELDDGRVVSVGKDTTVRIWKDQQNIKTYYCHTDSVNTVDVSAGNGSGSSALVATGGNDNRVCLLDINRSAALSHHTEHTDAIKRVKFTINNQLLSVGLDNKIVVWDVSRQHVANKSSADVGLYALSTQPASSRAIIGCMKGGLYSFDSRESSGRIRSYQPHAHNGTVRDIVFMDDTTFATGGSDGVVRFWDLRSQRQSYRLHCHLHREPVFSLATKDQYLLSSSRDGQVLLTDPHNMQTATILQMNYPISDISWNPSTNNVTVCSSKPHIELYELKTGLEDDEEDVDDIMAVGAGTPFQTPNQKSAMLGGVNSSAITIASPSKVDVILEEDAEQLVPIEGRKYGRSNYRQLKHPNKKAEKLWCTSATHPRINDREFCAGSVDGSLTPKYSLKGSLEGFVSTKLLSDKRHCLAMTAKGTIELWSIIEMKKIEGAHSNTHTMKDAIKACGPYAYGTSWCKIDCAWGALRITLSHDEAFNAQTNLWEYRYLASIANARENLSVYRFGANDRREMERKILNIGEEMLRMLNHQNSEVYVVQTKQGGSISAGSGADAVASASPAASSFKTQFSDSPDGKIPTWALTCLLSGPSVRSTPTASTSTVNVTLEPYESNTKFKAINLSVQKTASVADLCTEVMSQNKITLVSVGDLGDKRLKTLPNATASADEMIEFISVTTDLIIEGADEDDGNDSANSDCESDYAASSIAAGSSSCERVERVVDPLMMVVTAFYTYKERGTGTLRLRYRIRKPAPKVKVDDL